MPDRYFKPTSLTKWTNVYILAGTAQPNDLYPDNYDLPISIKGNSYVWTISQKNLDTIKELGQLKNGGLIAVFWKKFKSKYGESKQTLIEIPDDAITKAEQVEKGNPYKEEEEEEEEEERPKYPPFPDEEFVKEEKPVARSEIDLKTLIGNAANCVARKDIEFNTKNIIEYARIIEEARHQYDKL